MKFAVRYEVVRVVPAAADGQAFTIPHAPARTLEEAREIAQRDLKNWIIVERRVVAASDQPEKS